MSRMGREVETFAWPDTTRSAQEHRWVAEVEGRSNEIIYTTTWHATMDEALADAEAWARANGKVLVPF